MSLLFVDSLNLLDNDFSATDDSFRTQCKTFLQVSPCLKKLNGKQIAPSCLSTTIALCQAKHSLYSLPVMMIHLHQHNDDKIPCIDLTESIRSFWKNQLNPYKCCKCKRSFSLETTETTETTTASSRKKYKYWSACPYCSNWILHIPPNPLIVDFRKLQAQQQGARNCIYSNPTSTLLTNYFSICHAQRDDYRTKKEKGHMSSSAFRCMDLFTTNVDVDKSNNEKKYKNTVSISWCDNNNQATTLHKPNLMENTKRMVQNLAVKVLQNWIRHFLSSKANIKIKTKIRTNIKPISDHHCQNTAVLKIQKCIQRVLLRKRMKRIHHTNFEYIDKDLDRIMKEDPMELIQYVSHLPKVDDTKFHHNEPLSKKLLLNPTKDDTPSKSSVSISVLNETNHDSIMTRKNLTHDKDCDTEDISKETILETDRKRVSNNVKVTKEQYELMKEWGFASPKIAEVRTIICHFIVKAIYYTLMKIYHKTFETHFLTYCTYKQKCHFVVIYSSRQC